MAFPSASPQPFAAKKLAFFTQAPPKQTTASAAACDAAPPRLDPKTQTLLDDFERSARAFDALLASKGLSRAQLERFAERYIAQHPDKAKIQKQLVAGTAPLAVPASTRALSGDSIPRDAASRFLRA